MKEPFIEEITLDYIITKLNKDFGLKKTVEIGNIFGTYKNLQRILNPNEKKALDEYTCNELFKTIEKYSPDSFEDTVIDWFPSLAKYKSKQLLKNIIKANLMEKTKIEIKSSHVSTSMMGSVQFIQSCMEDKSPIKRIKIAEQTGWKWFDEYEKKVLLMKMVENKVEIQIIENPISSVMKKMICAVSDSIPPNCYLEKDDALIKWSNFEQIYDCVSFRISKDYPIFHELIIVEFENGLSQLLLQDYMYGITTEESYSHKLLFSSECNYSHYLNEFEFLWENAITYKKWCNLLHKTDELLKPQNYLLIYPIHRKKVISYKNSQPCWVYSTLSVLENNLVRLKINVCDSLNSYGSCDYCEYYYQGDLKVSRNNIYISLYDNEEQESINISLFRPINNERRFLGLLSALSPSGNPVAFKCACIEEEFILKINYSMLYTLLCNSNGDWDDTLMILEDKDINLFYSDRILCI